MRRHILGMVSFLSITATTISFAETSQDEVVSTVEPGYQRFIDSCAFCHGVSARGDGAAAAMLSKPPADLTLLAKNNGGKFPLNYVYSTIDGRDMLKSHGMREMPVWGNLWSKSVPPKYAESYVRARIFDIILFLDSIQE